MKMMGKCIGLGGCAEVFEWGNDKVIKIFRSNTTRDAVDREFYNSLAVWKSGLPVAQAYEQLEIDGRPGIIFEKIVGVTFKDHLMEQLYKPRAINLLSSDNEIRVIARLLFDIHKKSVPEGFTIQKESLKYSINWPKYLSQYEKKVICKYLDKLPEMNCICHGDPNPNNIIIRDGKPVIIDWMNATTGNPAADIVEFVIMFKYAVLPEETPSIVIDYFNATRDIIIEIFLDEYMKLSGMKFEDIDAWILPIAARKLSADAISEEEKAILVKVIRQRLYD